MGGKQHELSEQRENRAGAQTEKGRDAETRTGLPKGKPGSSSRATANPDSPSLTLPTRP